MTLSRKYVNLAHQLAHIMMIIKNLLFYSVIIIVFLSCKKEQKTIKEKPALSNLQITKIDSVCQSFINKGNTVGFSIAIAYNGKPVYAKGFGLANIDSRKLATENTSYAIASVSKFITAAATMKLVEENKLKLNDKIIDYFDDFPKQEHMDKITIEHLLRHQSGLVDHEDWFDSIYINQKRVFTREELYAFLDQPLFFKPGTNYTYSNSGYAVLSSILEKVSGQSFHEFIQENISKPLNAESIGMWPLMWNDTNASMGYELVDKELDTSFHMMTKSMKGDGGLSASVLDLIKFSEGLTNGTLISKSSLEKLVSPTQLESITIDYGLGVKSGNFAGHKSYGHSGGYKGTGWAMLAQYPESGFTFAAANNTNFSPEEIWMLRHYIMPIVLNIKTPVMEAKPIENIELYLGEYVSVNRWNANAPPSKRVISQKGGQLIRDNPATETPGTQLYPLQKHSFTWKPYPYDEFKFHVVNGKVVAVSEYNDGFFVGVRMKK